MALASSPLSVTLRDEATHLPRAPCMQAPWPVGPSITHVESTVLSSNIRRTRLVGVLSIPSISIHPNIRRPLVHTFLSHHQGWRQEKSYRQDVKNQSSSGNQLLDSVEERFMVFNLTPGAWEHRGVPSVEGCDHITSPSPSRWWKTFELYKMMPSKATIGPNLTSFSWFYRASCLPHHRHGLSLLAKSDSPPVPYLCLMKDTSF